MRIYLQVLVFALALLAIGSTASAQETKGWIGVDVQDVTKAEADKLGWDAPRGAKLGIVATGSPADRAGLKTGDIITAIDRSVVDTSSDVDATIAAKRPGDEVRLQVFSGGRERRVAVTVAERPRPQAADATAVPHLMLDPGGHMATIKGLAFTPDGKQVVSAGDDKVIRVWDWQAGKTVRTIRGQVGPGPEGQIGAMALSPDGRWLAVGGWMDVGVAKLPCCGDVRLYNFATGKLAALLKGHTSVVLSLAFSPDGERLISGSHDRSAIIWDLERRTLVHRLQGHKAEIYAAAFTRDGALAVTGSDDTTLKLWSVRDGKEFTTLKGHKDKVFRVAVSPTDGAIASGSDDGEIRLWDGKTGRYLRTLANHGTSVGVLSFSSDGTRLSSSCSYGGCSAQAVRVWAVATGNELLSYAAHGGSVLAAAAGPDGRLVATGGGNEEIHIWDLKTGETKKVLAGTGLSVWDVGIDAGAQRIAWGTRPNSRPNTTGPLEWQLLLPRGGQGLGWPEQIKNAAAAAFTRARPTHGPYALGHRAGGAYGYLEAILDVTKDGRTVASIERRPTEGYSHLSYSFTPDGQAIVSGGGGGSIAAYDLKGQRLRSFVGHESAVWAVTPSPDGRLLVSGSNDQTIRLWNLKTRELIVNLFHGRDGEWVMWTPQGYYMGSPGADKIVGWQINKGPDQAADYVGAEQLRQHLNRPDIIDKAIILASAEQAVREAPGTSFKLADLLARPVPRFKIVSPFAGSTQRGGRATVKIAIEATPDPVRLIRAQVNGRQVEEQTPDIGSGGFGAGERLLDVPLAKGRNEIRVTLSNAIGEKAETLTLTHDEEGDLDRRGTLHILAIGVNDYKGLGNACGKSGTESCDLGSPGADAAKFADAVEKRMGPGHLRVEKRVLVNGGNPKDAPTAGNIVDAVEHLRQAQETDTVVLFIAGHGSNEGPSYRFLPTDAEWVGGTALRGSKVVPWQILQDAVEAAKGRRILFIDTCHSGNSYNPRLGNAAYHANIIAYTAARFDQLALESPALGHGLFTYAVVEGLEGKGGLAGRGQISTKGLADYIVGRVGALAKDLQREQEPQYFKGRDAEDFVLARW